MKNIQETTKRGLLVLMGTLVLSVGTAFFIIPYNLVNGGVTGIAIAMHRLFPNAVPSVEGLVAWLGWGLFLVGWAFLGHAFAAKTLLSSALYPLALAFFSRYVSAQNTCGVRELLVSSVLGGALMGAGCALTFRGGGSTGGVDVIALLACRWQPRLHRSVAVFLVDAVTVVLGYLAFQNPFLSALGVLSALTGALTVSAVLKRK